MRLNFIALSTLASLCTIAAIAGGMSTNMVKSTSSATNQPVAKATNNPVNLETNKVAQDPGDEYTNCIGMELLKVPGGYWAGKFEVTQKEYLKVMGSNPSAFGGDKRPVDSVTWENAMEFCKKMTELDIKEKSLPEGYSYTLPTEDQWQFLAATSTLADAVTSQNAPRSSTAPVGSLKPNSLGLYDVRGNVSEFTLGDTSKPYRVLLGGNFADWIEPNLRLVFRTYCRPDETQNTFGFRCILTKN